MSKHKGDIEIGRRMATEKRLIDANALVKDLELLANHEDSFRQSVILGVVHTVKAQPTVDAVEVVRCKDCRFWADGVEGCTDDEKCCKIGYYMTKGNDYCAYGKRKLAE
jgi:hypothetical protein